jgi:uncharacterized protein
MRELAAVASLAYDPAEEARSMTADPNVPPPSPPPTPPSPPPTVGTTPDERTWATMAHASALIAMVLGGLMVLGPLIVYFAKKDTSPYVAHHAREALNFQILMLVVAAVLIVVGFVTCGAGWIALIVAGVMNIVLTIMGAMKANVGVMWTYPFSLRLVS